MGKKILIFCGLLIFLLGGICSVEAQDPGNKDTLWVERINMSQTLVGGMGRVFAVKCSVYIDQGLAAFTVPLTFYHARNTDIFVDSVNYESWVPTQTAAIIGFSKHNSSLGDTAKTFLFGIIWFTDSIPPTHPTSKLLCKIWFHTPPVSLWDTTKSIVLDTCTYYPPETGVELLFVDRIATAYKPVFVPGAIGYPKTISGTVRGTSLPCSVNVSGDRKKVGLTDELGDYSFMVGRGGRWVVFRDSSICCYDFNPLLRDTAGINFIGVSCSLQTCFFPQHFVFTCSTGGSYSLVIDSVLWNGLELDECSEVGVFDDTGGGMLCVGASVYNPGGLTIPITVWKDNPLTEVKDGYIAGDTIYFKVWSENRNREEDALSYYSVGDGHFESGSFSRLWLRYLQGDVNGGGEVGLRDVIHLAYYMLKGGPPSIPLSSGDVNCDDKIDIADVIVLARYVMWQAPFPC